jgi:hypothetical protein
MGMMSLAYITNIRDKKNSQDEYHIMNGFKISHNYNIHVVVFMIDEEQHDTAFNRYTTTFLRVQS